MKFLSGILFFVIASIVMGCGTRPPVNDARPRRPIGLKAAEVRRLIPSRVPNRMAWARTIVAVLDEESIPADKTRVCSVIAVIEQESGFRVNPEVPGLGKIVRKRLEDYARHLGPLSEPAVHWVLRRKVPGSDHSFADRIDRARTEKDLDLLFREVLTYYRERFPATLWAIDAANRGLGGRSLDALNPITTAGSMQVSVSFAQEWARAHGEDPNQVRDEIYTMRGGLRYGIARLLGYPAHYAEPIFRFADYNAGPYSSRNAAIQAQLNTLVDSRLIRDGDLLIYDRDGRPSASDSKTLKAFLEFRRRFAPEISTQEIRKSLLLEKTIDLEETRPWKALRSAFQEKMHRPPRYAILPTVKIISPKIKGTKSTKWFARSVDRRYKACMKRP